MSVEQRRRVDRKARVEKTIPAERLAQMDLWQLRAFYLRTVQFVQRRKLPEADRTRLLARVEDLRAELERRDEELPAIPAPRKRRRSPRPNPLIPKATPPDGLSAALEASLAARGLPVAQPEKGGVEE
jgi:hypothetical protein